MKKIILCFAVLLMYSCNIEDDFLIVEDKDYFEPQYRVFRTINSDTIYSLNKRFFVFNYQENKDTFYKASISLMCEAIKNDSLTVGRCHFNFQEMPWYSLEYNKRNSLTTDGTRRIVSYLWKMEDLEVISTEWGEIPKETEKKMELDCE